MCECVHLYGRGGGFSCIYVVFVCMHMLEHLCVCVGRGGGTEDRRDGGQDRGSHVLIIFLWSVHLNLEGI